MNKVDAMPQGSLSPTQQTPPPAADPAGWRKPLIAAAWPLSAAVACALYAFFPHWFPADAGHSLLLMAVAEIPALFIGVAHAAALAEPTWRGRMQTFAIGLAVLMMVGGLRFSLELDWHLMGPMLLWIVMSYLADLWSSSDDPALASQQAEAVLYDRGTLIGLIPTLAIAGVLAGIGLFLISLLLGFDFEGWLNHSMQDANPSLFALFGSAYLLLGAASAGYVHRPEFLRTRKRLLDRPWINALTRSRGSAE